MDASGLGAAFGGVKAGGQPDPFTYLKRPTVVIRICALLFSIIVFGCISSSGWFMVIDLKKEVCVMNMASSAVCHYSTFVGITGFIAAIGFLVGEWFFEQMSSIKSRKHYVILDMAFSGLWALFYAIAFIVMATSWRKSDEMFSFAQPNILSAIYFALLSVLCWSRSAALAYQRFKAGSDTAFSPGLGDEGIGRNGNQYQGFHEGPEYTGYNDALIQGGGQQVSTNDDKVNHQEDAKLFTDFGDVSRNLIQSNKIKGSYGTI